VNIIDIAEIHVSSGSGGNGAVAFRREKYVSNGGPSGGDGGRGGSVILHATRDLNTLLDFRHKRKFHAENGEDGGNKRMYGRGAEDLVIRVPLGTLVRDKHTGRVLADLTEHEQQWVAAKGGRGGKGNIHFATSTYQAPRYAQPGEAGVVRDLILELKTIADVGLVGLPNAGKSSLLASISAARPKIANYPFTTLTPNLGSVRFPSGDGFVVADIPGLIEGASEGVGLGHDFLRHIERTRLLLHMVDASDLDPLENFRIIREELSSYPTRLDQKPQLIVLNKADIVEPETLEALKQALAPESPEHPIFVISAATQAGTRELIYAIQQVLPTIPPEPSPLVEGDLEDEIPADMAFEVERDGDTYVVTCPHLERLLSVYDLEDSRALNRFQKYLARSGILAALNAQGAESGDSVRIGPLEFDYL
jgi:GTP-binding protein